MKDTYAPPQDVVLPCIVAAKNKVPGSERGNGEIIALYAQNQPPEESEYMLKVFHDGTGDLYDYVLTDINVRDMIIKKGASLNPPMYHPKYVSPTPNRGEKEVTKEEVLRVVMWYWSREDDAYVVESPLEPRILGAAGNLEDAYDLFEEAVEISFESHTNGKLAWTPGIFDVKNWPEPPFKEVTINESGQ